MCKHQLVVQTKCIALLYLFTSASTVYNQISHFSTITITQLRCNMTQIVCNLLIDVVTVDCACLTVLLVSVYITRYAVHHYYQYVVVKTLLIIENFSSQMQATEVKFDHTSKPELRFHPRRTSNRETPDLQLGIQQSLTRAVRNRLQTHFSQMHMQRHQQCLLVCQV